jgi:hypothetical protein
MGGAMGSLTMRRCRSLVVRSVIATLLAGAVWGASLRPAAAVTSSFAFTGGLQTFTVPAGVTR